MKRYLDESYEKEEELKGIVLDQKQRIGTQEKVIDALTHKLTMIEGQLEMLNFAKMQDKIASIEHQLQLTGKK